MLGKTFLQERASRKRTMTTADSGLRRMVPRQEEHEEQGDDNTGTKVITKTTLLVKVEYDMVEVVDREPGGTKEFIEETRADFEILRVRMKKGCCYVYNSSSEYTAAEHNGFEGKDLVDSVNLVLTNSPYNIRRGQNSDKDAQEILRDDMKKFAETFRQIIACGGHSAMFFSSYQFLKWCQVFIEMKQTEVGHDEVDDDITKHIFKQVFILEQKTLKFVRANEDFLTTPAGVHLDHTSMVEYGVHLWLSGYQQGITFRLLIIPACFTPLPLFSAGRTLLTTSLDLHTAKRSTKMLQGKSKIFDASSRAETCLCYDGFTKVVVDKNSQLGDLVYDQLAGSYETGHACMLLPLTSALHSKRQGWLLLEIWDDEAGGGFSSQSMSPNYDISGTLEVEDEEMLLIQSVDAINAKQYNTICRTPFDYPPLHLLPKEVVHFLFSNIGTTFFLSV